jgi:hypothetical protein
MHEPIAALCDIALPEVAPCQHVLHRDYETRCLDADLTIVGAHRYAANPHTEIICAVFAVDDGPVKSWLPAARDQLEQIARELDHLADTTAATQKGQRA